MKLTQFSSVGSLITTTIVALAVVAGGILAAYYVQNANGIRAFDAATSTSSNASNAPQTVHVATPAVTATNLDVTTLPAGENQGSLSTVQGSSFEIAPQPPTVSPLPPTPTPIPQPPHVCTMAATDISSCLNRCCPYYHGPEMGAVSPMIMCPMTTDTAQPQIACSPCGVYGNTSTIACKAY